MLRRNGVLREQALVATEIGLRAGKIGLGADKVGLIAGPVSLCHGHSLYRLLPFLGTRSVFDDGKLLLRGVQGSFGLGHAAARLLIRKFERGLRVLQRDAGLRQPGLGRGEVRALRVQLRLQIGGILLGHDLPLPHHVALAEVDGGDLAGDLDADRDIVLRVERPGHGLYLRDAADAGERDADLRGRGRRVTLTGVTFVPPSGHSAAPIASG